MSHTHEFLRRPTVVMLTAAAVVLFACGSSSGQSDGKSDGKQAGDAKAKTDPRPTFRIRAGADRPLKDSKGNAWLPDKPSKEGGFEGGDTIERPELKIENTKDPDIYRAEHYSMESFSWKVPNGFYTVKLHFSETFEGILGPGDRVFGFKLHGKEFKDFDVWKKAGGPQKAYIETVNIEVTDGKFKIVFTPKVENPQINGIEIIPSEKPSPETKSIPAAKTATDKS